MGLIKNGIAIGPMNEQSRVSGRRASELKWVMTETCSEVIYDEESRKKEGLTALFTNMRILKFKSQLANVFFAAVNHLNGPLRKQLYFNGFKRSWLVICEWWISIHFVCFYVSRFVACDHNYD